MSLEHRILVLTPTGRDAEALCATLARADLQATSCRTVDELCDAMREGAGVAVIADEALTSPNADALATLLEAQPEWSDFPLLFVTSDERRQSVAWKLLQRIQSHALVLERPVRTVTLLSAVNTAMRSRTRQYQVREELEQRRRSEQQMRIVMAELNHRVKNTLAVVDSVARQTARRSHSLEEFRESFGARLRAIASAHGLLTATDWEGASIRDVLESELKPRLAEPEQLVLEGPQVNLDPKRALALHMAVHEMSTNASKYGALSQPSGRLTVRWFPPAGHDPPLVELTWIEAGGPTVTPPIEPGFGTALIDSLLKHELDGSLQTDYDPRGVRRQLRFRIAESLKAAINK